MKKECHSIIEYDNSTSSKIFCLECNSTVCHDCMFDKEDKINGKKCTHKKCNCQVENLKNIFLNLGEITCFLCKKCKNNLCILCFESESHKKCHDDIYIENNYEIDVKNSHYHIFANYKREEPNKILIFCKKNSHDMKIFYKQILLKYLNNVYQNNKQYYWNIFESLYIYLDDFISDTYFKNDDFIQFIDNSIEDIEKSESNNYSLLILLNYLKLTSKYKFYNKYMVYERNILKNTTNTSINKELNLNIELSNMIDLIKKLIEEGFCTKFPHKIIYKTIRLFIRLTSVDENLDIITISNIALLQEELPKDINDINSLIKLIYELSIYYNDNRVIEILRNDINNDIRFIHYDCSFGKILFNVLCRIGKYIYKYCENNNYFNLNTDDNYKFKNNNTHDENFNLVKVIKLYLKTSELFIVIENDYYKKLNLIIQDENIYNSSITFNTDEENFTLYRELNNIIQKFVRDGAFQIDINQYMANEVYQKFIDSIKNSLSELKNKQYIKNKHSEITKNIIKILEQDGNELFIGIFNKEGIDGYISNLIKNNIHLKIMEFACIAFGNNTTKEKLFDKAFKYMLNLLYLFFNKKENLICLLTCNKFKLLWSEKIFKEKPYDLIKLLNFTFVCIKEYNIHSENYDINRIPKLLSEYLNLKNDNCNDLITENNTFEIRDIYSDNNILNLPDEDFKLKHDKKYRRIIYYFLKTVDENKQFSEMVEVTYLLLDNFESIYNKEDIDKIISDMKVVGQSEVEQVTEKDIVSDNYNKNWDTIELQSLINPIPENRKNKKDISVHFDELENFYLVMKYTTKLIFYKEFSRSDKFDEYQIIAEKILNNIDFYIINEIFENNLNSDQYIKLINIVKNIWVFIIFTQKQKNYDHEKYKGIYDTIITCIDNLYNMSFDDIGQQNYIIEFLEFFNMYTFKMTTILEPEEKSLSKDSQDIIELFKRFYRYFLTNVINSDETNMLSKYYVIIKKKFDRMNEKKYNPADLLKDINFNFSLISKFIDEINNNLDQNSDDIIKKLYPKLSIDFLTINFNYKKKIDSNQNQSKITKIKQLYENQFINYTKTCYYTAISEDFINTRNYIQALLLILLTKTGKTDYTALILLNKYIYFESKIQDFILSYLYFNPTKDSSILEKKKMYFIERLMNNIYVFYNRLIYSSNNDNNEELVFITKKMEYYIQFLQLLAEFFNISFHPFIFHKIKNELISHDEISLNDLLEKILDDFSESTANKKLSYIVKIIMKFMIEYKNSYNFNKDRYDFNSIISFELNEKIIYNIKHTLKSLEIIESIKNEFEGYSNKKTKKSLLHKINYLIEYDDYLDKTEYRLKMGEKYADNFINITYNYIMKFMERKTNSFDNEKDKNKYEKLIELYHQDSFIEDSLDLDIALSLFLLSKKCDFPFHSIFQSDINKYKNATWDKNKDLYKEYKFYTFLDTIVKKIDINYKDTTRSYYFIRPAITFFIESNTKHEFQKHVNRTTTTSKLVEYLKNTDYFIFEMYVNKIIHKASSVENLIKFHYYEYLNFGFIISEQFILLFLSSIKKDIDFLLTFSFCHIMFVIHILYKWYKKYKLTKFVRVLMSDYKLKFIYDDKNDSNLDSFKYFYKDRTTEIDEKALLIWLYKKVGILNIIKIVLLDLIILNREINIFIFNLFAILIYLFNKNDVFLSMTVLFVTNQVPFLKNIINAMRGKWKQFIIVLLFTYVVIYVFMAFSHRYLQGLFRTEVTNPKTGNVHIENPCSSMLNCYFNMINYSSSSSGGISNILPQVSFDDMGSYIKIFVYNLLFHVVVVLVLGNMFFGIIIDTFNTLRQKTDKDKHDKENVCFICQEDKDGFLINNKDPNKTFEDHKNNDHNIWNYVYFVAYINFKKSNDLNYLEYYVLDCLKSKDISWLPIAKRETNDEIGRMARDFRHMNNNMKQQMIDLRKLNSEVEYLKDFIRKNEKKQVSNENVNEEMNIDEIDIDVFNKFYKMMQKMKHKKNYDENLTI